jgi:cytochrome c553
VHICSSCHGLTGRSISPNFPILAGQQQEYLEVQLHAFRDQTRADPHAHTYMWGMAKHLDDPTIEGVAAYFASQPAVEATQSGPVNKLGAAIYAEGVEAREVPACVACHGEKAEGQGPIPRLAGQHAGYLAEQLGHFRSNARSNETMHMNALNLTDTEIAALAEYLSAL